MCDACCAWSDCASDSVRERNARKSQNLKWLRDDVADDADDDDADGDDAAAADAGGGA